MLKLARSTRLLSCFIRALLPDASGQLIGCSWSYQNLSGTTGPLDMRQTASLTIFKAILKSTFSPWLLTKCETLSLLLLFHIFYPSFWSFCTDFCDMRCTALCNKSLFLKCLIKLLLLCWKIYIMFCGECHHSVQLLLAWNEQTWMES